MTLYFKGILWKKYQNMLIPEYPPHYEINLSREDKKFLLKRSNAFLIRWPSDWDTPNKSSWWYIICDKYFLLSDLSSNTRNQIRRGLIRNNIRLISAEELKSNGYSVYIKAFEQYKTFLKPLDKTSFENSIDKLSNKNWDLWGAFNAETDQLVAYSQNYIMNGTAEYKVLKLDPYFRKDYPSYALIYKMNEYYLKNKGYKYTNDGARSISHASNIQEFLVKKFKFRKAYCKLNIYYSYKIWIFVFVLYPIRYVLKYIPHNLARKVYVVLLQESIKRNGITHEI